MKEKPKEFALEYAGFWIRLGAGIVDLLFLYIVCSVILWLLCWIINYAFISLSPSCGQGICLASYLSGETAFSFSHAFIPVPLIGFIVWLIEVAYFTGFWVWRGQTPGKMLLGIKVIRTDSSPINLPYSLLRYLGYIVSMVTLFVGFVWIAFDSRKQGIHDKVADTYVVKLPVRQIALVDSYARGEAGCV